MLKNAKLFGNIMPWASHKTQVYIKTGGTPVFFFAENNGERIKAVHYVCKKRVYVLEEGR